MRCKFAKIAVFLIFSLAFTGLAHSVEQCSDILSNSFKKWKDVKDYTCTLTAYNRKGELEDLKVYSYKFMKPNYVYMKIIKGKSKGAKVYYDPTTNRVKGCKKIFFYICRTFDPTAEKVTSIRGAKVYESTMGFALNNVKAFLDAGAACEVKEEKGCILLHLRAEKPVLGDVDEMRVCIDRSLGLPVWWEKFAGGVLVNKLELEGIKLNVGLTKEDFKP